MMLPPLWKVKLAINRFGRQILARIVIIAVRDAKAISDAIRIAIEKIPDPKVCTDYAANAHEVSARHSVAKVANE